LGESINDVQRGLSTVPTGVDSKETRDILIQRMTRIVAMKRPDVQSQLLADLRSNFTSHVGSPRTLLEARSWPSEEDRLLYLRYMLELELGGQIREVDWYTDAVVRTQPLVSIESKNIPSPNAVIAAMIDYETGRLRALAAEMVPQPPPHSNPLLALLDSRGTGYERDRRAAEDELSEYQAYLFEITRFNEQQHLEGCARLKYPGPDCPRHVSQSPATVDLYQQYIGGPFESTISRAVDAAPALVSLMLDFVPIVGQLKAVAEAIIGRDLITDRPLADWERGLNALLAIVPSAKGIFKTGRSGLRLLAETTVKSGQSAEKVFRVTKAASKLSEAEVLAAKQIVNNKPAHPAQFEKVAGSLDEMIGAPKKGARAKSYTIASGVIEDGRALSGAIAKSPTKVPAKPVGRVAKPTVTAPAVRDSLVKAGITRDAIAALERVEVRITGDLAKILIETRAGGFVNRFHKCSGFEQIVKDLVKGDKKKRGALFVIDFVMDSAHRIDPVVTRFEVPVGITKHARAETASRLTDVVTMQGSRVVNYEFKANTKASAMWILGDREKVLQLVKDVVMLKRQNIRWVFDSAEVSREFVYKKFREAIKNDALLAKEFGAGAKLEQALEDMIIMYSPKLRFPAGLPLQGATKPFVDDQEHRKP
jgi:hypothetical protein